tara:strand:- start:3261 stop:4007 length:747 start_codon:yes stop_codon:yes gene_type:complete
MRNPIVIILAAGKGTRMQSNIPKVLHTLKHKTLIERVISTSSKLNPKKIIIVIGHEKEKIKSNLKKYKDLEFVIQEEQKGTGHAVKMCFDNIKDENTDTIILSGDVPLISLETLKHLINKKNEVNASAIVLTSTLDNPDGYGRIIKNQENQLKKITEHKDCNEKELEVNEINAGIYVFENQTLIKFIPQLTNNNSQAEYYLPDAINLMIKKKHIVNTYKTNNIWEIKGINDRQQLIELTNYLNTIEKK